MTTITQRLLILTRHAKAVDEDIAGDHGRALSPRGLQDAANLGKWLGEHNIIPQQVFCSSATRTRQTLVQVSENMSINGASSNLPTILRDKMYMATAGELLAQVQGADDEVKNLMLVGHNPGMHGLLAMLVSDYVNESDAERVSMKFPTAACAVLRITAEKWSEVSPASAVLEFLHWSVDG